MLKRGSSLAVLLMVATGAGAAAQGFVVDGGDEEAALALCDFTAATARRGPGLDAGGRPSGAHGPHAASDGLRVQRRLPHAPEDPQVRELRHAAALRRPVRGRPEALRRQRLGQHPSAHGALAAATAALFAVNTVTGVWNLAEGRKDPNHRTKRTVHGVLMLVADAGFVATGVMAPENEHEGEGGFEGGGTNRSTHRTVALTSMGIATVGYLIMLIH